MSAPQLRLETERLELIAFTSELIGALPDRPFAERLVGARIPDSWPDAELAELLAASKSTTPFGPWVVVSRSERAVVGSAGFIEPPKNDRTVELGFGTHQDFRGRGYAPEAARALVEWALEQPNVERVVAKCDPDNAASIRVLEKIGMQRCGESEEELLWEMRAPGAARFGR
jgi:RimJ/RimL family protein N-acetyltransferase